MKRFLTIISPLAIVVILVTLLANLKHVQSLDKQEQHDIVQFKKEQADGGKINVHKIYSKEDFTKIATALNRLRIDAYYRLLGPGRFWIRDYKAEFEKINAIVLNRDDYTDKQRKFIDAFKIDLEQAQKQYGKKASYATLSDLSYYAFPLKGQQKKPQQLAQTKTLFILKKAANQKNKQSLADRQQPATDKQLTTQKPQPATNRRL